MGTKAAARGPGSKGRGGKVEQGVQSDGVQIAKKAHRQHYGWVKSGCGRDGAMQDYMRRRQEVVADLAQAGALGSSIEGVARSTARRQVRISLGTRAHAKGRKRGGKAKGRTWQNPRNKGAGRRLIVERERGASGQRSG